MAGALDGGAALVSATNGKTTTAAMVAAILERRAARSCTTAPARTWAGAWPPPCWTRGAGRGQLGPVRGGRGLAARRWPSAVQPARVPAVEPVPRPARPLRRAGDAGRPLGRARGRARRRGARFVLNADDPLVADLGRGREGVVYFGVERPRRRRCPSSARCRLQALPQLRHALRLRGRAHGPHRPLPLPRLRPRAARARGRRPTAVELDGMSGARVSWRTPAGALELAFPCPASTTSTTPSAAAALAWSWARRWMTSGAALEGFGGAFGRVGDDPVDGRAGVHPAGQEPRGRQRGAAHPDAGGRRSWTCGWRSTTG